jgi:hypothetical protein
MQQGFLLEIYEKGGKQGDCQTCQELQQNDLKQGNSIFQLCCINV